MAESDFDSISNNRSLCDAEGNIGPDEFCAVMLKELRYYMQHRLTEEGFSEYRTPADTEFTSLGATKMILTEQLSTSRRIDTVLEKLGHLIPSSPQAVSSYPAGNNSQQGSPTDSSGNLAFQESAEKSQLSILHQPNHDKQCSQGISLDGGRQDAILQSILSVQKEILQHVLQGAAREANLSQRVERMHEMLEGFRPSQTRKKSGFSVGESETSENVFQTNILPRAMRRSSRLRRMGATSSSYLEPEILLARDTPQDVQSELISQSNGNFLFSSAGLSNQNQPEKPGRMSAAVYSSNNSMQLNGVERKTAVVSKGTQRRFQEIGSAGSVDRRNAAVFPDVKVPSQADAMVFSETALRSSAAMAAGAVQPFPCPDPAKTWRPIKSGYGVQAAPGRQSHLNGNSVVIEGREIAELGGRNLGPFAKDQEIENLQTTTRNKANTTSVSSDVGGYRNSALSSAVAVDGLLGPRLVRVARHTLSEKQAAAARAATQAAVASLQAQGAIPPGLLGGIGATQGQRGTQPGMGRRAPVASLDWQPSQRIQPQNLQVQTAMLQQRSREAPWPE